MTPAIGAASGENLLCYCHIQMSRTLLFKARVKVKSWLDSFRDFRDTLDLRALDRVVRPVEYPDLKFVAPSRALRTEMLRGPDREPETRAWIDLIPRNSDSLLWDIGANVGSFTIYAASSGINVVAVEPVPANLLLLSRNIDLNGLQARCIVLPMAMSDVVRPELMQLSTLHFGAARHRFGSDRSYMGGDLVGEHSFQLAGCNVSDAVLMLGLPAPTHLKIDVDGIDDKVLFGAAQILGGVKTVCCEMHFSEERVKKVISFMAGHGLILTHRTRRNAFFERTA